MLILLFIFAAIIFLLGWGLFVKDEALTDAKASLASQKVLTDLTQKDADRYLRFYELECAGREQDGVEARDAISTLEHDLAVRELTVRQQVERINHLTRTKRDLQDRLNFTQMKNAELAQRLAPEMERGNELAKQCQDNARRAEKLHDLLHELKYRAQCVLQEFPEPAPRPGKTHEAIRARRRLEEQVQRTNDQGN